MLDNWQVNKNDNIHKNEVQQIRWSDEYWQYRVAANITEYQNNLLKFMEKKQLFHVKNVCKNAKSLNERMDFWTQLSSCFLHCT